MKTSVLIFTLLINIMTSGLLTASPIHVKNAPQQDLQTTSKKNQLEKNSIKKIRKKKLKKKKRFRFFSIFKKDKKEKEYKIKNKWMRISVKIFLYCLFVFVISVIFGLIGTTNPHTFFGNDLITSIFYTLGAISFYVGLAALLSIICAGIAILVDL